MTLFESLSAIYARDLALGTANHAPISAYDLETTREVAGRLRADAFGRAVDTVAGWIAKAREHARNPAAARELGRLDDRLLADIGVPRSSINYMVVNGLDARPVNDDQRPVLAGCA